MSVDCTKNRTKQKTNYSICESLCCLTDTVDRQDESRMRRRMMRTMMVMVTAMAMVMAMSSLVPLLCLRESVCECGEVCLAVGPETANDISGVSFVPARPGPAWPVLGG